MVEAGELEAFFYAGVDDLDFGCLFFFMSFTFGVNDVLFLRICVFCCIFVFVLYLL